MATDSFVLDRLYGRLGKPVDRLEYVLPLETYQLYEERFLIQNAICHGKLEDAWKQLEQFEQKREAQKPLHKQFILANRAQILWLQDGEYVKILSCLEAAIAETMHVKYTEKEPILEYITREGAPFPEKRNNYRDLYLHKQPS